MIGRRPRYRAGVSGQCVYVSRLSRPWRCFHRSCRKVAGRRHFRFAPPADRGLPSCRRTSYPREKYVWLFTPGTTGGSYALNGFRRALAQIIEYVTGSAHCVARQFSAWRGSGAVALVKETADRLVPPPVMAVSPLPRSWRNRLQSADRLQQRGHCRFDDGQRCPWLSEHDHPNADGPAGESFGQVNGDRTSRSIEVQIES